MRVMSFIFSLVFSSPSVLLAGILDNLPAVLERSSHRASSYDRTGGNIDNVTSFAPKATHLILDADGPGRITHIWLTVSNFRNHSTFLRDLVIRMYWENSEVPSVEVPLGDFFALGHGKVYTIRSIPVAVGINSKALNCYWPMPFYKHARIELYNHGRRSIRRIYYNIDYELGSIEPDQGLFHAEYRRDKNLRTQAHEGNTTGADNYVILETTGRGQYVGCALFIDAQPGGWWGEGDEMIFIDHSSLPVIIGTGSEDYFCNAWGYGQSFSYPFYGAPLLETRPDKGSFTTVYRWHIPDPVRFRKHIRVTIEHLFGEETVNDYSSVAYWYQTEPIKRREPLGFAEENHPKIHESAQQPSTFELDGTELEPILCSGGVEARGITANIHDGYQNNGWLRIQLGDAHGVEIPIEVPQEGNYRVSFRPVNELIKGSIRAGFKSGKLITIEKRKAHQHNIPDIDLGTAESKDKSLTIVIEGNKIIGIDRFMIEKVDNPNQPIPPGK